MKRYVKEFHKDMVDRLNQLGSERHEEYLQARLKMDRALSDTERGLITDYEAVREIVNAYEWIY